MGADQPGFTLPQVHIGLGQLGVTLTQALYFPALEGQAGLESVFDEVIMARSPSDSDRVAGRYIRLPFAPRIVVDLIVRERIIRAQRCMARACV
mgnify:CR=1 FL=1